MGDGAVELTIFYLYSWPRTCTLRQKAVFSQRSPVKKPRSSKAEPVSSGPRKRRRRAIQYALVLVGLVIVIDALVGERGLLAMRKARQQYHSLEGALAAARAENARLREEAKRLIDEPSAIEDLARRELGLIKPGEKLFILRDVPPPPAKN
jgi:cell division protein FtsB